MGLFKSRSLGANDGDVISDLVKCLCLSPDPPIGWDSRIRTTQGLAGWICSPADLRTSPQLVTFRLVSQVPQ